MFKSIRALALLSVSTFSEVKADESQDFMTKLMANAQGDSPVEATFSSGSPVSYF